MKRILTAAVIFNMLITNIIPLSIFAANNEAEYISFADFSIEGTAHNWRYADNGMIKGYFNSDDGITDAAAKEYDIVSEANGATPAVYYMMKERRAENMFGQQQNCLLWDGFNDVIGYYKSPANALNKNKTVLNPNTRYIMANASVMAAPLNHIDNVYYMVIKANFKNVEAPIGISARFDMNFGNPAAMASGTVSQDGFQTLCMKITDRPDKEPTTFNTPMMCVSDFNASPNLAIEIFEICFINQEYLPDGKLSFNGFKNDGSISNDIALGEYNNVYLNENNFSFVSDDIMNSDSINYCISNGFIGVECDGENLHEDQYDIVSSQQSNNITVRFKNYLLPDKTYILLFKTGLMSAMGDRLSEDKSLILHTKKEAAILKEIKAYGNEEREITQLSQLGEGELLKVKGVLKDKEVEANGINSFITCVYNKETNEMIKVYKSTAPDENGVYENVIDVAIEPNKYIVKNFFWNSFSGATQCLQSCNIIK